MFDRELKVALRTAQAAAKIVAEIYERGFSVTDKGKGEPVTDADRSSNDFIIAALRAAFPDDAICDEEGQTEAASQAAARGGRCWFVDPLDGTREFIARSGEFCVMIGLAMEGRATLGVVCAPVWQRTFVGVIGEQAYELGPDSLRRPLRVSWPAEKSTALARLLLSRLHRNAEVEAAAARLGITTISECGSTGLKLMRVASGESDLYLHTGPGPKLWDGCAPEAIARAAGAVVTDAAFEPLRYDTAHLPLDRGLIVAARPLATAAALALGEARRD